MMLKYKIFIILIMIIKINSSSKESLVNDYSKFFQLQKNLLKDFIINQDRRNLDIVYHISESTDLKLEYLLKEVTLTMWKNNYPVKFHNELENVNGRTTYFIFYDTLNSTKSFKEKMMLSKETSQWVVMTDKNIKDDIKKISESVSYKLKLLIFNLSSIYQEDNFKYKQYHIEETDKVLNNKEYNILKTSKMKAINKKHQKPNLRKIQLNVVAVEDKPYFFIDESGNYTGYLFDILKELESSLNFTVMLTTVKNINDISALKQYDIQLKLYSTFTNKSENIKKSFPVMYTRPKLYYCRPEQLQYWKEYINTFNNNSWIVIITTFILLSIILSMASKIITTVYEDEKIDMNTSIFFICTAIVQQNVVINTNSQGIRLIIWSTFITSIFILTIYTADLTSDLTYTKVKIATKTLDDVMNTGLQLIIIRNSVPHLLIQETTDSDFQKIKKYLSKNPEYLITNTDLVTSKLAERNVFLFTTVDTMEYLAPESCNIDFIDVNKNLITASIGYNKDFHLRRLFDNYLNKMNDAGILDKNFIKYIKAEYKDKCEECKLFIAFGYQHVSIIIYTWIAGLLLSIIIMIIENIFYYYISLNLYKKRIKNNKRSVKFDHLLDKSKNSRMQIV